LARTNQSNQAFKARAERRISLATLTGKVRELWSSLFQVLALEVVLKLLAIIAANTCATVAQSAAKLVTGVVSNVLATGQRCSLLPVAATFL